MAKSNSDPEKRRMRHPGKSQNSRQDAGATKAITTFRPSFTLPNFHFPFSNFYFAASVVRFRQFSAVQFPTDGVQLMARRQFLARLAALPFLALGAKAEQVERAKKPLHIFMKSAWGSDDPTRAAFAFAHSLALAEAGHEVQIFLLGEATYLMRKVTADAATPIGWPPIGELRDKVVAKHIPVFACGVCSRARGITESDLATWNAKYGNPTIFVGLVEWADRIITE
jgi:sulfur relay (sulfurtransferase) complex TusBCD TusD component (DsrE family)